MACSFGVSANLNITQTCQMHVPGIMLSMKTWRGLKMPVKVAMQQSGFSPDGPRYKMAELGYTQLGKGRPENEVKQRVNALCHTFKPDDILDDEPLFNAKNSTDNTLCSDLATSITGSIEGAGTPVNFDDVMNPFLQSDMRPQPRMSIMVKDAIKAFQLKLTTTQIADNLMDQCEKLKQEDKDRLSKEFYSE